MGISPASASTPASSCKGGSLPVSLGDAASVEFELREMSVLDSSEWVSLLHAWSREPKSRIESPRRVVLCKYFEPWLLFFVINLLCLIPSIDENGRYIKSTGIARDRTRKCERWLNGFEAIHSFVAPRVFPKEKGQAWVKHNIEEVGAFETFLPQLYNERKDKDS